MYEGDSFLTLSLAGRAGLVALSVVLAAGTGWLVMRFGRNRARALRVWLAVMAYWAFLWLSPQIYYFYYMILIEELPWQSVIKRPPSLTDVLSLLSFTDVPSLSNHAKGVLGWGLVLIGISGAGRGDALPTS